MRTSVALLATRLAASCALFALIAPTPAVAQVTNGDFEVGGTAWSATAPTGWTADFPVSGGNPGGYGRILSSFGDSEGLGSIEQTFPWGRLGTPGKCHIQLDYKLDRLDANAFSARVRIAANGITHHTSPPAGGSLPWTTVSFAVPCSLPVELGLSLEVDAGNNGWRACFDNVRAECLPIPEGATFHDFESTGTPYALANFSGTPAFLFADGSPNGTFLRLAAQSEGNLNTVAFDRTALGAYLVVTAEFDFRMTPEDLGAPRADGLGFALLSVAHHGDSGPGPEITEEPNAAGSIGVGFDIFENPGESDDNHISVHYDGTQVLGFFVSKDLVDLADGVFHHARLTVDYSPGCIPGVSECLSIEVYVDDILLLGVVYANSGIFFPYEARVAFGARTGGLSADHDIDNICVSFQEPAPVPPDGFNPDGSIRGHGWNLLFPLVNPLGCTAGGSESMKRNWVAPYLISDECPKAGDSWGDIDFGNTAAATGWGGEALDSQPVWFTIASLAKRSPPVLALAEADTVDYKGVIDIVNQSIPGLLLPSDNTLALATTYVENQSGAPLAVDLLTTSEDSLQVWVNNALVVNRSLCPTLLNDPLPTACFLPPGVSKIATLCWNGTGGWNFRLGIRRSSDGHLYTDADAGELAFLGPGDAATRGQQQYIVQRELAGKPVDFSCSDSAVVRLQGSGPGDPGDLLTIVERVVSARRVAKPVDFVLSEVTPPGEVTGGAFPGDPKVITWRRVPRSAVTAGLSYRITVRSGAIETQHSGHIEGETVTQGLEGLRLQLIAHGGPVGIFEDHHTIGQPPCETMPALTFDAATDSYTMGYCGSGPSSEGDQLHFAYTMVTGDFVAQARVLSPPVLEKQSGLMARISCDADAKFSAVLIQDPCMKHVHRAFHRDAGSYREDYVAAPTDPMASLWLRMVRLGNAIYTYAAPDENGEPGPWCLVGSDSHAERTEALLVGVAASSEAEGPAKPVDFDHLSIEPLAPSPPPDPESFGASDEVLSVDFDSGIPPAAVVVRRSGAFTPRATGGRLRLTEDGTMGSATAVWFLDPELGLPPGGGFVAEFDAYAVPIEILSPVGDGFTFAVVQAAPVGAKPVDFKPVDFSTLCGDPGGGLGYEGGTIRERAPCHPSFAVEFDTYVNEPGAGPGAPQNEPTGTNAVGVLGNYHVGLDVNGSVSSLQTNWDFAQDAKPVDFAGLPDLFAPEGIHVEVRYSPTRLCRIPGECEGPGVSAQNFHPSASIDVWVSSNSAPTGRVHVVSEKVPSLSGELVMGFTAATGGATGAFEVDNVMLGAFCSEAPDSATISGPVLAEASETVDLMIEADTGGDGIPLPGLELNYLFLGLELPDPQLELTVISGPGVVLGQQIYFIGDPVQQLNIFGYELVAELGATAPGDVTVQFEWDDGYCPSLGPTTAQHTVHFSGGQFFAKAGDFNLDGVLDISDAISILLGLFANGRFPCGNGITPTHPSTVLVGDTNGDGRIDLSDAVSLLHFLFRAGRPPARGTACMPVAECPAAAACP